MTWPSAPSFRLRLTPVWPALAALISSVVLLWWQLPDLQLKISERQLQGILDIVAPQAESRLDLPPAEFQHWAALLPAGGPLRITVIRPDGEVMADSARTFEETARMENHGRRPEVLEALADGRGSARRRSATTGKSYLYAARTLTAADGSRWVLRVAQPIEEHLEVRRRLLAVTAVAAAVGLLVMGLVSLRLDRRYFRPAARLIEQASALAGRGMGHSVEVPEQQDLARLARVVNRFSAQGAEQLAALEAERDQLKLILSSMSEGVLVTDAGGRAVLANPAFRELFGLPEAIAGLSPVEICRRPQLAAVITEVLEKRSPQPSERQVETPDDRTVVLTGAGLRGNGGAVVVARDVTEEDRLVTMRRDFVANVSHELKTPLAAIRGYAETLGDGALDEPPVARRFVERILGQCRRLQVLLEDLLTLSRLESVSPSPDPEPVDLREVAEQAFETVRAAADEKQVHLELDLEDVPPIAGRADDLERLLVNLLQNAVKYNRPGGRARLKLRYDGAQAIFEVEDTGLGIPQESLPRLFERFYRVDKGRSRAEGGTGLGLSIVKHVTQAHGGEVEVESSAGVGSTFRVRLPVGLRRTA
ncbi:MAG: PAS-domain containing protein [Acidobacteria bacterium]|nr:PAS-domain containing protein [Acidobacteriota bacterium]